MSHKRYLPLFTIFFIFLLLSNGTLSGQSLGDPVVHITFGAGTSTHAGALPADSGYTSYTYSTADFPTDGSYTIENTTAGAGNVWWSITDHTGNTGGYMMIVNASEAKTDYFYQREVDNLCGGVTYQFSAYAGNLLRSQDKSPPDITFSILNASTGATIQSYDTGAIALTPNGFKWIQYKFNFTLPANVSNVIIKMTNNSNGGAPANDLALDDITFSPYGSTVSVVFNNGTSTTETTCAGVPQAYTINSTSTLATGYEQKLQEYVNGAWVDLSAPSTSSTFSVVSPTTAGTYQYRLVSAQTANINTPSCVVSSNYLTIVVTPSPVAAFTNTSPACLGSAVTFTDASAANGSTITSWAWDFGDGSTSSEQNPLHTYTAAGTYTVKLTVATNNGCAPSVTSQQVQVNPLPVAAYTASSPNCISQPVTFTDGSTTGTGTTLTSLAWDFGDGATITQTSGAPFQHTYTTAGTFTVKLTVTNSVGCTNTVSQNVLVSSVPIADFSMPDVCLSDAYAQFTDKSTVDGAAATGLTYSWNFDDANATAANPNTSTDQNPKHKYSQTGIYTVTLTVTSPAGCVSTIKSQQFTVNGAIPKAGLTIENSNSLCSSDPVVFDNTSSVDFGNITRIVFYFDYDNSPMISETYLRDDGLIPSDGKFYHSYGTFNTPSAKTYHVKMVVYSGESCFDTFDEDIVVHANPTVTLSAIGSLCQYDSPVQITEDKNGFSGTGTFSGTGVSSTGLFNPTTAGPGTYTINYIFTADNGCSYSTSQQVTVYANPTVSLPASVTILQGGQITLAPTIQGSDLTYQWSPSTGLSAVNIADPVASPSNETQYTLTVKNANGCTASATIDVAVLLAPIVPNTFTPNGDGINDTWVIKNLDTYPNCRVQIFNRNGTLIFNSIGYPIPWDGTYNGSPLPVGVYYYMITPGSGRTVMAGSLTILR